MSQVYLGTASTPSVPTSFVTDSGTATPAANSLSLLGDDTTDNDVDGIRTVGSGSTLTVELTNRLYGTGTTVGATTADLITFDLGASAQVFVFKFSIVGRDTTSGDGVAYDLKGTLKTDGAAATIIDIPDINDDEDVSIIAASIAMVASGNNAIVRATGVAGCTISYAAKGEYIQV
jgi:hypothetical protein